MTFTERATLLKISLQGFTRDEVEDFLGPCPEKAATTRKRRHPLLFRYGRVEITFEPWKLGKVIDVYINDHMPRDYKITPEGRVWIQEDGKAVLELPSGVRMVGRVKKGHFQQEFVD